VVLVNQALNLSTAIGGWLSTSEMEALYALASDTPTTAAIVELGAWQGKSTIMLAAGSRAGQRAPVFSVDYFSTIPDTDYVYANHFRECKDYLGVFQQNLTAAGLSEAVTPIRSKTSEAGRCWNGPQIGLLFIDADHRYQSVRDDFLAWASHCTGRASVAFHDYGSIAHPGVRQFVDQLLTSRVLINPRLTDTLLYGELAIRDPQATRRQLLRHPRWLCNVRTRLSQTRERASRFFNRFVGQS